MDGRLTGHQKIVAHTVEENNLNLSVSALRRVLGESPGENRYIATVPGHGYRFVADVKKTAEAWEVFSLSHKFFY